VVGVGLEFLLQLCTQVCIVDEHGKGSGTCKGHNEIGCIAEQEANQQPPHDNIL
jgi:hypothetical protein